MSKHATPAPGSEEIGSTARGLPFIVAIFADLSGDLPVEQKPRFRDRVITGIDRHNFDTVLSAAAPRVDLSDIDNLLPGARTPKLAGLLGFESLDDFSPAAVARRIDGLRELFDAPGQAPLASWQLSRIMHAPVFKALEATWRGLHRLVTRTDTGPQLQLKVLNASRNELYRELAKAVSFEQSSLFRMIHDEEYGTCGGQPYSLLLGAHEFGPDANSLVCLNGLADVAAEAHAPFIAAASPELFGMDSFDELNLPRSLAKIFESVDFVGWNTFRDREESRYVSLVLPRVLMRPPYGEGGLSAGEVDFQEMLPEENDPAAPETGPLLWGNGAFLLAERITDAATRSRWPSAIRGVEGGGRVTDLPLYAGAGGGAPVCPTGVAITDRREDELARLGFIPLCHWKGTDQAVFFSNQSTCRPKRYLAEDATAAARVSARLSSLLVVSRFAHAFKRLMREKTGSFLTRDALEACLNDWISQYVLPQDDAPPEARAQRPLRSARVQLSENTGAPGTWTAELFLQPHFPFQAPESVRLAVELPA